MLKFLLSFRFISVIRLTIQWTYYHVTNYRVTTNCHVTYVYVAVYMLIGRSSGPLVETAECISIRPSRHGASQSRILSVFRQSCLFSAHLLDTMEMGLGMDVWLLTGHVATAGALWLRLPALHNGTLPGFSSAQQRLR